VGLEVLDNDDHWVTVGRKGKVGRIHLCQPTEGDVKSQLEPGNSGILFLLPGREFERECARLKERGVEFSVEPRTESWGTYAMIRDPDGNEHALMPEA
jgi:predicted enzyme related to lactoylglutathione lyase